MLLSRRKHLTQIDTHLRQFIPATKAPRRHKQRTLIPYLVARAQQSEDNKRFFPPRPPPATTHVGTHCENRTRCSRRVGTPRAQKSCSVCQEDNKLLCTANGNASRRTTSTRVAEQALPQADFSNLHRWWQFARKYQQTSVGDITTRRREEYNQAAASKAINPATNAPS